MIRIQKLTPPQITALREACPGLLGAGMLTTTASTATFTPASPADRRAYPKLDFDMHQGRVYILLIAAKMRTKSERLDPIILKLSTGKDLVVKLDTALPAVAA